MNWLPFVALTLAVAAPGPKDPAPKKADPPTLVGEWAVQTREAGGKPLNSRATAMEFTNDGEVILRGDGLVLGTSRYTADPAKTPAEFDWFPTADKDRALGIFKVDGDALTLCVAPSGLPRPAVFQAPAGVACSLRTLKRVPKKK